MLKPITKTQLKFLKARFRDLLGAHPVRFSELKPSTAPESAGVYVVTVRSPRTERPYYVGRTKNLRRRLYTNHLMGSFSNARLKKHLVTSGECTDIHAAKEFIKRRCSVRWIEQEGFRERGAIEGYATGLLFPKHGIYEEH